MKIKTSALFFLDARLVFGDMEGDVAVIRLLCRSVSAAVAPLRSRMTSLASVCSIPVPRHGWRLAEIDALGNEQSRIEHDKAN